MARLLAVDGKTDDALKEATSIVTEEPNSTVAGPAFQVIGQLQTRRDRPEDAIAAYKDALREPQPVAAGRRSRRQPALGA